MLIINQLIISIEPEEQIFHVEVHSCVYTYMHLHEAWLCMPVHITSIHIHMYTKIKLLTH